MHLLLCGLLWAHYYYWVVWKRVVREKEKERENENNASCCLLVNRFLHSGLNFFQVFALGSFVLLQEVFYVCPLLSCLIVTKHEWQREGDHKAHQENWKRKRTITTAFVMMMHFSLSSFSFFFFVFFWTTNKFFPSSFWIQTAPFRPFFVVQHRHAVSPYLAKSRTLPG